MRWSVLLVLVLMASGCSSNKVNFKYPSDISSMCHGGKNSSKAKIEGTGTSLKRKGGLTLKKHPGEKKFGRMWAWMDPSWNMYVGGLCWGNRIEVGCHPGTGGEVMPEVVEHEHAHYWLITNSGDYGHNPKYRGLFYNWVEPRARSFMVTANNLEQVKRQVKLASQEMEEGEWISVDGVDADGNQYHIDFVVSK